MRTAVVLIFGLSAVVIGLIQSGFWDPKPVGALAESWQLNPQDLRPVCADQPTYSAIYLMDSTLMSENGQTITGLSVGGVNNRLQLTVDSFGYAELLQHEADGSLLPIVPFATFPHVGREMNELWIDVEAGHLVSVRINRELFWHGRLSVNEPCILPNLSYDPLYVDIDQLNLAVYFANQE